MRQIGLNIDMTKRKRKKARLPAAPAPLSGPPPEQLAPREKTRSSVEDPLLDWPDDALEADRWLLERDGVDESRG